MPYKSRQILLAGSSNDICTSQVCTTPADVIHWAITGMSQIVGWSMVMQNSLGYVCIKSVPHLTLCMLNIPVKSCGLLPKGVGSMHAWVASNAPRALRLHSVCRICLYLSAAQCLVYSFLRHLRATKTNLVRLPSVPLRWQKSAVLCRFLTSSSLMMRLRQFLHPLRE